MKLSAYLGEHAISDSAFAERIGVTRQSLWRYKSGERRPDWDVLERIAQETAGHVTPNDFLDEAPPVVPDAHASDSTPHPHPEGVRV
ncbi:hypothetical protein JCM16408A_07740 [Methylobacterium phyllosphaerae]|nr:helix-turn-helix transcriptional regulator [Methylobacterium phyllosphaerae]